MAAFTDSQNREWTLALDPYVIKDVRETFDINLLDIRPGENGIWEKLFGDLVTTAQVLWFLCREQAEKQGVDERSFASGLHGDGLQSAVDCLVGTISDFFPDPKRRQAMKRLVAKGKELDGLTVDQALQEMEATDLEQLAKSFTDSAGSSPDSPASPPAA